MSRAMLVLAQLWHVDDSAKQNFNIQTDWKTAKYDQIWIC